jgi:hypothetical protein
MEPTITAGSTVYEYRSIDGRACYVALGHEDDPAFTFLCKTDKESKRIVFVNFVSRAKCSALPDVAALEDPEPLDETIVAGSTTYRVLRVADQDAFVPEHMLQNAPAAQTWFVKLDKLNSRHFFVNAETKQKVWMLPEITDYTQRVIDFVKRYSLTPDANALIANHEGDAEACLRALVDKHGPEPANIRRATRERLAVIFTRYAPQELPNIDAWIDAHEGKEDEFLRTLEDQYGAAPPTYRERVTAIYTHYNPEKLASVDEGLRMYAGKELLLIAALVKKYGPEPHNVDGPTGKSDEEIEEYRARVTAMYHKYNPAKLSMVEQNLEMYKGQEELLMEALITKYGPEPDPDVEAARQPPAAQDDEANHEPLTQTSSMILPSNVSIVAPPPAEEAPPPPPPSEEKPAPKVDAPSASVLTAAEPPATEETRPRAPTVTSGAPTPDPRVLAAKRDTRPPAAKSYEERVAAIYAQYAPAAIEKVPKALAMYGEDQYDILIEALIGKYGPEPTFTTSDDPAQGMPAGATPAATPREHVAVAASHRDEDESARDAQTSSVSQRAPAAEAAEPAPMAIGNGAEAPESAAETPTVAPATVAEPPADETKAQQTPRGHPPVTQDPTHADEAIVESTSNDVQSAALPEPVPEPERTAQIIPVPAVHGMNEEQPSPPTERPAPKSPPRMIPTLATASLAPPPQPYRELIGGDDADATPGTARTHASDATMYDGGSALQTPRDTPAHVLSPATGHTAQSQSPSTRPSPRDEVTIETPRGPVFGGETSAGAEPGDDGNASDRGTETATVAQAMSAGGDDGAASKGTYRDRVMRFYLHYRPKKASDAIVDRALAMYAGQEEELIEELERKFGPEPPTDTTMPRQQSDDPTKFDRTTPPNDIPTSLIAAFAAMARSDDQDEAIHGTMMLRKLLMASDPPVHAIVQEDAINTFAVHLDNAMHAELRFEAAWAIVLIAFTNIPHRTLNIRGSTASASYRERVTAIYKKHCPDKLHMLDQVLERYSGQERLLIESLVKRYGAESNAAMSDQRRAIETLAAQYCADVPQVRVSTAVDKFTGHEGLLVQALKVRFESNPSALDMSLSGPMAAAILAQATERDESPVRSAPQSARGNAQPVQREAARQEALTRERHLFEEDEARLRQVYADEETRLRRDYASIARNDMVRQALTDVGVAEQLQRRATLDVEARERSVLETRARDVLSRQLAFDAARDSFTSRAATLQGHEHQLREAIAEEEVTARSFAAHRYQNTKPIAAASVVGHTASPESASPAETPARATAPPRESTTAPSTTASSSEDPSPLRQLREALHATIRIEADPSSLAVRDAHHLSIIGSLATFEVRLREAYDRLSSATEQAESLRDENMRLTKLLAVTREEAAAQIDKMNAVLLEAQTAARELERAADYDRANLKSQQAVAHSAALHDVEVERLRTEELKLEHARTLRELHTQLADAEDRRREYERHTLNLTQRLRSVEAELLEANRAVEHLASIVQVDKTTTGVQCDIEAEERQVREQKAQQQQQAQSALDRSASASFDEHRHTALRLVAEVQEWKSLALRLRSEVRTLERQHAELTNASCEECDTAAIVIGALRDKNRSLEQRLGELELAVMASPPPLPANEETETLRAHIAQLRGQLSGTRATVKQQQSEIQDLRGLLAIHMASPTRQRRF